MSWWCSVTAKCRWVTSPADAADPSGRQVTVAHLHAGPPLGDGGLPSSSGFAGADPPPDLVVAPPTPEPSPSFECQACQRSFKGYQALTMHNQRVHHQLTISARFCDGPTCRTCGSNFGSRLRCRLHIDKWAPRCRRQFES
eukprot:8935598-Alexandrium_andersonii.AAC.1